MAMTYDPLEPKSVNPFDSLVPSLNNNPTADVGAIADRMIGNAYPEPQQNFDLSGNGPIVIDSDTREDLDIVSTDDGFNAKGMTKDALEFKGVNWETPDANGTKTFTTDPGFYDIDYDPTGAKGEKLGEKGNHVLAANVFGRQFSRDQLLKDDEGRRIVSLMEKRRTGDHRDEGFWSGATKLNEWTNVPFIGWMADLGTNVSEAINISKTMRKMQNGEKVSDHDALSVRRFMLQQEMESERGISYNVGSLVRQSIPFMAEMAMAGSMIAASTAIGAKVGAAVGTVAGPGVGNVVGGIVGGGLGLVFGGGRYLSKLFGKTATKTLTKRALSEFAERGFDKGFTFGETRTLMKTVKGMMEGADDAARNTAFKKVMETARNSGRDRAMLEIGKEMAESDLGAAKVANWAVDDFQQYAMERVTSDQIRKRSGFETAKYLAEQYKNVHDVDMDTRLARYILVNGDVSNMFDQGLMKTLEESAIVKQLGKAVKFEKDPFGTARRAAIVQGLSKMDDKELRGIVEGYVNGTVSGALGKSLGGNGLNAIRNSMQAVLGETATVNHGYAQQVADMMGERMLKGFQLRYGEANGFFARNWKGFWSSVGDGVMDGLLRWDKSVFGSGLGTLARSGNVFGGYGAALKEAAKISFVEAPVRGAMQLGAQIPLWPVTAAVTGNNPMDFTIRGQLGIQSQALQTGDRQLMDHARAIALGSAAVEYISENAGRGFNVIGSSIAAPASRKFWKMLPEGTREFGSHMAQKVNAMFGPENLMKAENRAALASAIANDIRSSTVDMTKRGITDIPSVTMAEVEQFVKNRSAKGITNLESFLGKAGLSEGQLQRNAISKALGMNKARAGLYWFTSTYMMEKGLTPQAMNRFLENVGYDGIISEMAEERYGGFFQGLFGLNERPSNDDFKENLKAAWEGLFPDKKQLITEALGFAIPSILRIGAFHAYSRLGKGLSSKLDEACVGLNVNMSSDMTFNLPVDTPEQAAATQKYREDTDDARATAFGTDDDNSNKIVANAENLLNEISMGAYTPTDVAASVSAAKDKGQMEYELRTIADSIVKSAENPEGLEATLKEYDAERLFGADGVEAIRNQRRKAGGGYVDQTMKDFDTNVMKPLNDRYAAEMKKASAPASVDDIVNSMLTVSVPTVSEDGSMVSEQLSKNRNDTMSKVRVNQFGEDPVTDAEGHLSTLADALYRMKYNGTDSSTRGHRWLMRCVGVLDAITTGDMSLAMQNPVEWALADHKMPKDVAANVMSLVEDSLRVGRLRVMRENNNGFEALMEEEKIAVKDELDAYNEAKARKEAAVTKAERADAEADMDDIKKSIDAKLSSVNAQFSDINYDEISPDVLDQWKAAGAEYLHNGLRRYASAYLASRNVAAFTRSDLTQAAVRAVAYDKKNQDTSGQDIMYRLKDGTLVDSYADEAFVRDHVDEIEEKKAEIRTSLVQWATNNVIRINTHSTMGMNASTAYTVDLDRAIRYGTSSEVQQAILETPAFSGMRQVKNVSGGGAVTVDEALSFARECEVNDLCRIDVSKPLSQSDTDRVVRAMGRDYVFATPEENEQAAVRFVKQLRVRMDQELPVSHHDKDGNPVSVAYRNSAGGAVATVSDPATGDVLGTFSGTDMVDCVMNMEQGGYTAEFAKLVVARNFTIMSHDATSLVQVYFGNRDQARDWYVQEIRRTTPSISDTNLELHLPPYLRKTGTDWKYPDSGDAAIQMRKEMAQARADEATATDTEKATIRMSRSSVVGEDGIRGYESVASEFLGTLGIHRSREDASANMLSGGAGSYYAMHPSMLPRGNVRVVTCDYFSNGDGEALLRNTVSSVLRNHWNRSDPYMATSHDDVRTVFRMMEKEFSSAAESLASELDVHKPELAARIRNAVKDFDVSRTYDGRPNFDRLAAIFSAMGVFSCDRGVGDKGNGFLFSPELAAIADQARGSGWAPLFMSVVDEAFGGPGLFSDSDAVPMSGLARVLDAFAPSGSDIARARKQSLFNRTGDNGEKATVVFRVQTMRGLDGTLLPDISDDMIAVDQKYDEVNSIRLNDIYETITRNYVQLRDDYQKATGQSLTTQKMVEYLSTRASVGGGSTSAGTRASVTVKDVTGAEVAVQPGAEEASKGSETRTRTAAVIPDDEAYGVAKLLSFVPPPQSDLEARARFLKDPRVAAMRGELTDFAGLTEAVMSEGVVRDILFKRGMSTENIDRVVRQLGNAFTGAFDAKDELDLGDEIEAQEDNDVREDEGSQSADLAQQLKAMNAAIRNKDLMEAGKYLRHLFPHEGNNHLAIFTRAINDVTLMVDTKAHGGSKSLEFIARELNLSRGPRGSKSYAEAVSEAYRWDDERTDDVLTAAVRDLADMGREDLAAVFNALRLVEFKKTTRRCKALRQLASMSRFDGNQVTVSTDEDGRMQYSTSTLGTSRTGANAAVRAVMGHVFLSPMFGNARNGNMRDLADAVAALDTFNVVYITDKYDSRTAANQNIFNSGCPKSVNIDGYLQKLGIDNQSSEPADVLKKRLEKRGKGPVTAEEHDAIVGFARELSFRYAAVADAIDYMFGEGNEVCDALRNPDLVGYVVDQIEYQMTDGDMLEHVVNAWANRYVKTLVRDQEEKDGKIRQGSWCPFVDSAIVEPMRAAVYHAIDMREQDEAFAPNFDKNKGQTFTQSFVNNNARYFSTDDVMAAIDDGEIAENLVRYNFSSAPTTRSKWLRLGSDQMPDPGRVSSDLSSVFAVYNATMPRATGRVSGVSARTQFQEDGHATLVGSSDLVAAVRIVDSMLSKVHITSDLTAKEDYLQNYGRFSDGSRLTAVTVGSRFGSELTDQRDLAKYVCLANMSSYIDKRDITKLRFQLYRGEKPTAFSIQLPGVVCDAILSDIRDGKEYTANTVTKAMDVTKLPKSLDDESMTEADRTEVYNAIYSVVASGAGCDQIDPKRTQVLMAQGTPVAGFQDKWTERTVSTDGAVSKTVHSAADELRQGIENDGDPVIPGEYTTIVLASSQGKPSEANMGGYYVTGCRIDGLRGISTNPDSVSFKTHDIDWLSSTLTKGQSHDISLGIDDGDLSCTSGAMREAQRLGRRRIEKVMNLPTNILEKLPAEASEEEKAKRAVAVERAKAFLRYCTYKSTDVETQKTGPFSGRCGFFAEKEGDPVTLTVKGTEVTVNPVTGAWKNGDKTGTFKGALPEFKQGYNFALTMQIAMEALGETELEWADVAEIESEWIDAKGLRHRGKFLNSGILVGAADPAAPGSKGDRVSFEKNEGGSGYLCHYFSRRILSQIMANSDAKSEPGIHGPLPTNAARDNDTNAAYRESQVGGSGLRASDVMAAARGIPHAILRTYQDQLWDKIWGDKAFADAFSAFPNSRFAREQIGRKLNAATAKSMRPSPVSYHGVLCPSGMKAHLDTAKHVYVVDETSGVTEYDRDCFRPARPFGRAIKDELGMSRTYPSGCVNVRDDGMRYGWHLSDEAFKALSDRISDLYVSCTVLSKARFDGGAEYGIDFEEWEKRLDKAFGQDSDLAIVKKIAPIVYGAQFASADSQLRKDCRSLLGSLFTDYTGRTVDDNPSFPLDAARFDDLFMFNANGEFCFDYAAIEFGEKGRKQDNTETHAKSVYLGGAFFSADRRPSGNMEAASGFSRAQAPVMFDETSGLPGPTAMYILDPVTCAVQGSDTDGDSATVILMSREGYDRAFVERCANLLRGIYDMSGKETTVRDDDEKRVLMDLVNDPKYADMFVRSKSDRGRDIYLLSEKFTRTIGNALFQIQIDNYRLAANLEQDVSIGSSAVDAADLADVYDIGFSGRAPVGPTSVTPDKVIPADDVRSAELYRRIVGSQLKPGTTYAKAFKGVVNAITSRMMVKNNMLDPVNSAFLIGSAADAGEARGVGVKIQAQIEHLGAFVRNDEVLRKVAPALYTDYVSNGRTVYRPLHDFIGHFDGISNALFDVVKDLFAPRAGWQKDMLQYLAANLLRRADEDFAALGTDARFGDAWFFRNLVRYVEDFHTDPTSVPGLLKRAFAGNNMAIEDGFGLKEETPEDSQETVKLLSDARKTLRGVVADAITEDSGSVISYLAEFVPEVAYGKRVRDENGRTKTMSSSLRRIVEDTKNDFAQEFKSWCNRLGRAIKFDPRDGSPSVASMLASASSDPSMPSSLADFITSNGDAVDGADTLVDMMSDVLGGYGIVIDGEDPSSCVTDLALCATAGHFLLSKAGSDSVARLAESADATVALGRIRRLQDTEAALSPDKTMREGGTSAGSMLDASLVADKMIAEDNDAARLQLAIVRNRLQNIVRGNQGQFSSEAKGAEMLRDRSTVDGLSSGDNAKEKYDVFLKKNDIMPMSPVGAENGEFLLYVAARMWGSPKVRGGQLDANWRLMDHLAGAVKLAVDSCEGDLERFMALMNEAYTDMSGRLVGEGNEFVEAIEVQGPKTMLGTFVSEASKNGYLAEFDASIDTVRFLSALRVDELSGRITLTQKFQHRDAETYRRGLADMLKDKSPVYPDGRDEDGNPVGEPLTVGDGKYVVRVSDLASMLRIHLCATQPFDSVRESDVRVDVSSVFGDDQLREMERWGRAVTQSLPMRALLTVPQVDGSYDLLGTEQEAPVAKASEDDDYGIVGETTAPKKRFSRRSKAVSNLDMKAFLRAIGGESSFRFSPTRVIDMASSISPVEIIARMATGDTSFSAAYAGAELGERVEYMPDERPRYARADELSFTDPSGIVLTPLTKAPFKFTGRDGVKFDFLEDAVNDYMRSQDAGIAKMLGDLRDQNQRHLFFPTEAMNPNSRKFDQIAAYYRAVAAIRTTNENRRGDVNPKSVSNIMTYVLAQTMQDVGPVEYDKWVAEALADNGEYTLNPASRRVRSILKGGAVMGQVLTNRISLDTPAPRVSVAMLAKAPGGSARMSRGAFSQYMRHNSYDKGKARVQSPIENVRFAMETAFGKDSVSVEQVTRTYKGEKLPLDLVRITRKLKGKTSTRNVVTYMSFGEALKLDVTREHMESLLETINRGRMRPLTIDEVMAMSPEMRMALADVAGATVTGLSDTSLSSDALSVLTGLVRFSDDAGYFTVFHEYFHQMLAFFRRTGLCTEAEFGELQARFTTNGRFDEEAAADAFAEFVTGDRSGELGGKLLASGVAGDRDKLFRKFRNTASALLAGAISLDANGAPAVFRFVLTADMSDRDVDVLSDLSREQRDELEDILVRERTDFAIQQHWSRPDGDVTCARRDAASKLFDLLSGTGNIGDLEASLAELVRQDKPDVTFAPSALGDDLEAPEPEAPAELVGTARLVSDRRQPLVARVQAFMKEAMKRLDSGIVLTPEEKKAVDRLCAFPMIAEPGNAAAADTAVALARQLIRGTMEALGVDEKDLYYGARATYADEKVAELAMRLVKMSQDTTVTHGEDGSAVVHEPVVFPEYARTAYVLGTALSSAAPETWGTVFRRQVNLTTGLLESAAKDLEARARTLDSEYSTDADRTEAGRLRADASTIRKRASDFDMLVTAVARGDDYTGMIPTDAAKTDDGFQNAFTWITNGARGTLRTDGSVAYTRDNGITSDLDGRLCQTATDSIARTLGVAFTVRRYVIENGVESPANGADPVLPENPIVPPPGGVYEPDTVPQMILQSPTSWMVSDLFRGFQGTSIRDMVTDTSLQALAEAPNTLARNIDFIFGADVAEGDSPREIEYAETNLGRNRITGLFEASKGNVKTVRKIAAVRGYAMGIVTRSAKTVGPAFDREDRNLVHVVLETIGAMANGDPYFTGNDVGVSSLMLLGKLMEARNASELTGDGKWYSPRSVIDRVKGQYESGTKDEERPSELDQVLYRIATYLPAAITGVAKDSDGFPATVTDMNGMYGRVLKCFHAVYSGTKKVKDASNSVMHEKVVSALVKRGLAMQNSTGKTVITVPTPLVEDAWKPGNATFDKLVAAGRAKETLALAPWAWLIAAEANGLMRAAMKSRYLTDGFGSAFTGFGSAGLWFENGTGHHQLVSDDFTNRVDQFMGKPSPDAVLEKKFDAYLKTITSHNQLVKGKAGDAAYIPGYSKALDIRVNEDTGMIELVGKASERQINFLMSLLGIVSHRASDQEREEFLLAVKNGYYTREEARNRTGFVINPDITMFEFDRLILDAGCSALVKERYNPGSTILTKPESQGGYGFGVQDLVDLREVLKRSQGMLMVDENAESKFSGRINALSETEMFMQHNRLGSSKTCTERLRSMAEAIVQAERFRGCLVQMLASVGHDGSPNYVVKPTENATEFATDEYWGALARFVSTKMRRGKQKLDWSYDDYKSGVENMRDLADAIGLMKTREDKTRSVNRAFGYNYIPPEELRASGAFEAIWALKDPVEDRELMAQAPGVGGEAAGYMRQLFGSLQSPSMWGGWRKLDRLMAYSKAASVGMSAFFAFATRFESPVAAVGLLKAGAGMLTPDIIGHKASKGIAELMRKLGSTDFGKAMGLDEKLPYLVDIMDAIVTDDPAVREMRELAAFMGMPLSDAIQNPMSDRGSAIDRDIEKMSEWLVSRGHTHWAKEIRDCLKVALHNPGEYTFSNVLNCVKLAVVSQTMYTLRKECETADRPFDPVRELRRHSSYINAEIGGMQAEEYAWLTPGMQQLLRLTMFSHSWTMGAWVAGSGDIITDLLFGGHHSTPDSRKRFFIRWLRMLGIVKFGVPMVMQLGIHTLASVLQKTGIVGDPDDPKDKDPLAIDEMPWWCLANETQVGSTAFDITPILKLCGRVDRMGRKSIGSDYESVKNTWLPGISAVVGAATGAVATRSLWGTLAGAGIGAMSKELLPSYDDVGDGRNTSGRRRYYMHFGKQANEYWRWFYDAWGQATSKLSIPLQKVVEAFYGTVSGNNYRKRFAEKDITDRFFTTALNPNANALTNWMTAFVPFSANSVMQHPDAGLFGLFAPVSMGTSMTGSQKRIVKRLSEFANDDRNVDVWASPRNKKQLDLLCSDILREAKLNGMDPKEVLKSGLAEVTHSLYVDLFDALPKREGEYVDGMKAARTLRALYRVNNKLQSLHQSLRKQYKNANVDWKDQSNAKLRIAVKTYLKGTRANPWMEQDEADEMFDAFWDAPNEKAVRQAGKGGEALANFLATDEVPETLFGIPVVTKDYTEDDLAFFREYPEAGGYYDLEDGGDEPMPPNGPGTTGAGKGGKAMKYFNDPGGAFYSSFESKPVKVMKDGQAYYRPTKDKNGNYDVGGYRSYWSFKQKKLVDHNGPGLVPEKAYLEGKRRLDSQFDVMTNKVYSDYGLDVKTLGRGVDTAARDIVFSTGGKAFRNESPMLQGMFSSLRKQGLSANDAFGVALAFEQDTYGGNNLRRFAARGGTIMDDLSASENPTVKRFADAYRSGWTSAEGVTSDTGDAFGTNWERHTAGMREAAKVADELGLSYSARGNK